MKTTLDVQRQLKARGFNPGPEDGAWGRLTRGAVIEFQSANGLTPDGIVGPLTSALLFETTPAEAFKNIFPPWYLEGQRHLGLREVAGPRKNRTIMDWADDLDAHYFTNDDIPWCGLFTGHCFHVGVPDEPMPSNILGARNWAKYGRECDPIMGACLVFWRTHKTKSFNGHVGFYDGERKDAYRVLGGNQSNSVSRTWISKDRLLEARWPSSVPIFGEKKIARGGGKLSTNEA